MRLDLAETPSFAPSRGPTSHYSRQTIPCRHPCPMKTVTQASAAMRGTHPLRLKSEGFPKQLSDYVP